MEILTRKKLVKDVIRAQKLVRKPVCILYKLMAEEIKENTLMFVGK
jgi:hypothetical protein